MRIRRIGLCFGLSLAPAFTLSAHACYNVIVLEGAGGQGASFPTALNASGQQWPPGAIALADEPTSGY